MEGADERIIDWDEIIEIITAADVPTHLVHDVEHAFCKRVTRCSGCINWDVGGRSLSGSHGCQKWLITTPPEFFCAGAEPCER